MEINNPNIQFAESTDLNQNTNSSDTFGKFGKNNWITFCVIFLFFLFLNLSIYLILYKTSWPIPKFFRYLLLNYPLYFLNIGFLIFYTHPSFSLSRYIKNKFEINEDYSSNLKRKNKRAYIFYISLVTISLIGGVATFGLLFWIMPALLIILVEYWLLRFFSDTLIKYSENINSFNKKNVCNSDFSDNFLRNCFFQFSHCIMQNRRIRLYSGASGQSKQSKALRQSGFSSFAAGLLRFFSFCK